MREPIQRWAEATREWWSTYSIYIMIPASVGAFIVALYYMLHDVM